MSIGKYEGFTFGEELDLENLECNGQCESCQLHENNLCGDTYMCNICGNNFHIRWGGQWVEPMKNDICCECFMDLEPEERE